MHLAFGYGSRAGYMGDLGSIRSYRVLVVWCDRFWGSVGSPHRSAQLNLFASSTRLAVNGVPSVRRKLSGRLRGAAAALDSGQAAKKTNGMSVRRAARLRALPPPPRATLVVDEIANDLLDGLFPEVAVHLTKSG